MSRINLPDVTLIAVDTACHELTRMAIEDSCKEISFAKVIVFTNRPEVFNVDEVVKIDAKNNVEAEQILWYKVPKYVSTTHILTIQWDGWVVNSNLWDPNWLEYDYIGAPWLDRVGFDVGNGGFSLRSKRLMDLINKNRDFQHSAPEDQVICKKYRRELESRGFRWADKVTAEHFSFENPPTRSFGFHAFMNWPFVMSKNDLEKRKYYINDYIKGNSQQIRHESFYYQQVIRSGMGFGFFKDDI